MTQGSNAPSPPRRWLKPVIIVVVLGALTVGGFLIYRTYEPDRLTRRARGYVASGDYRNAVLTVRRALTINPASRSASRLMAEITEELQVPDAIDWRRRVAELNPGSAPDALAWADTALRMQKSAAAEQALAAVPEAERNTATYQSKAGTLALSSGKWQEARKYYAEALRLEPNNELHQYNNATLQLQSPDPAERKAGAETLDRLAKSGRVQTFARRSLVTRLCREEKWDQALQHSAELVKDNAAQFGDHLIHLQLLHRSASPDFPKTLAANQERAQSHSESAALMLNWMRMHGFAPDAVSWARSIKPEAANNPRVSAALADCLVETRDWEALRKLTEETNWAQDEPLRLAYLARALREQQDLEGSRARWTAATSLAVKNRESATRLAYLATRWNWSAEARETLWAAVDSPGPQWALQMLHRLCQAEGDTNGLLRVASRFVDLDPTNDPARNNVAMLSLLLGRDTASALATARELHEKKPADPVFASTYAYALHVNGQSGEGLAILKKLPPEQLREPGTAAYYGVLLAATGSTAEAHPYLDLAKSAPLLPEEKALVESARR